MAFGLGVLRHSSRDFWTMTPIELASAWRGIHGEPLRAPSRAELQDLMRACPDEPAAETASREKPDDRR